MGYQVFPKYSRGVRPLVRTDFPNRVIIAATADLSASVLPQELANAQ